MLAFGEELEVATNVLRAFREGALCGPVKWLLAVDHFTLSRSIHMHTSAWLAMVNGHWRDRHIDIQ